MFKRTLSLALTLALLALPALAQDKTKDDKGTKDAKDKDAKDKGKDDKGKVAKAEPFDFPLKVGTVWTYRVAENRYTLTAAKLETVGKQECVRIEMKIGDKAVSFEHLALARIPKGSDEENTLAVMRYSFEGKEATPPIPMLLIPDEKKAWRVNSKIDGKDLVGTFRKIEEDVKVPAGVFTKAVKVTADNLRVNGVDLNITYWFVSGVGMVKQEAEMAGSKVVIELERMEKPK
jgi:hypothetical protein